MQRTGRAVLASASLRVWRIEGYRQRGRCGERSWLPAGYRGAAARGVENGLRDEGVGEVPADDAAGEGIDDEGDVGEAYVGLDVRDVGDPEVIGGFSG